MGRGGVQPGKIVNASHGGLARHFLSCEKDFESFSLHMGFVDYSACGVHGHCRQEQR